MNQGPIISIVSGESLAIYRRVKIDSDVSADLAA